MKLESLELDAGKKSPARRALNWLFPAAFGLALLLIAVPLYSRLAFFVNDGGQRFNYPYFQPGSEGLILSEAAIIRAGQSIYVPLRPDAFISAPYPPLYYYLLAWLWPSGDNYAAAFQAGRLISLVAALATACFIAGLVYFSVPPIPRQNRLFQIGGIGLAVLAGFIFLSLPAVNIWAFRVRPDMLMTALQLAGLVLVALGIWKGKAWPVFAAIACFVLALGAKQTALAGPAAATIYLALHSGRRWRPALAWPGLFGAALLASAGLLNLLSGGELFLRLFKYHSLPWLRANFDTYSGLFAQENAGLLLLSGGLAVLAVSLGISRARATGPGSRLDRLLAFGREIPLTAWYLLFSLVLLLGLGVAGADHNHFLPAEAATVAAAGTLGLKLLALPGKARWLALLALAGLGCQAAFFSVPPARYEIELRVRPADYQRQLGKIIAYVAAKPGPVLSSEAAFYVLAGKAVPTVDYYNDLFTLAALDRQGLYGESGLLDRVRRKEFSVVLAEGDILNGEGRPDVWTPELVAALKESYILKYRDVWYTFEPKP